MGQSLFKVSTVHTSEVQTSHTYKMNPAVLISAVAFACIGSTNAIFGSSIHWNRCFDHWYRWNPCSLGRRYRRSRCPSSRCCWCSHPLEGCCPPPFEPTKPQKEIC